MRFAPLFSMTKSTVQFKDQYMFFDDNAFKVCDNQYNIDALHVSCTFHRCKFLCISIQNTKTFG